MPDFILPVDRRFLAILWRYSEGRVSAYNAACEIQELGLPGYDDPSASEVLIWTRRAGFNWPAPSAAEAAAEAEELLKRRNRDE